MMYAPAYVDDVSTNTGMPMPLSVMLNLFAVLTAAVRA
jgi:hypothetical protein